LFISDHHHITPFKLLCPGQHAAVVQCQPKHACLPSVYRALLFAAPGCRGERRRREQHGGRGCAGAVQPRRTAPV